VLVVLPIQIKVRDRIIDETGEYEVVGPPYTTNDGKNVHIRVRRITNADLPTVRTWGAHERVAVKRASPEEDK